MEQIIEKRAFKKGLNEVDAKPGRLGVKLRKDLMVGLGIRSRQSFWARVNGVVTHTPIEIHGIERIFASYGCRQPWDV